MIRSAPGLIMAIPANTPGKGKGNGSHRNRTTWVEGQPSPNPLGRPKDGESWASIIKAVGNMYSDDLLAIMGTGTSLAKKLKRLPKNVQLKYLVTFRIFAELMTDPNPGLWNGLMDRAEGKVPFKGEVNNMLSVENLEDIIKKVYGSDDNTPGEPSSEG